MPSTIHQALGWAFADDPPLAFELMRELFDVPVPALRAITDRKSELDRYAPCFGDSNELRPDLALSGDLAEPSKFVGGVAIIIEVQRKRVDLKRWRLAVYRALLAERLRRTTTIMLVTLDDAVATWARGLPDLELCPCECLQVLDRHIMPRMTSLEEALQRPSKALLSALLHSTTDDIDVLQAAFSAALQLPDDRRWRYASAILAAVSNERKEQLKGTATMQERYELTRMERNSIAWHDGHEEGLLEGKCAGLIELVLTIIELRSLPLDSHAEQRIRACADVSTLERWAARARRATAVAELFDDPG